MKRFLTLFVALSILLAGCGAQAAASQATPTPYPTPVKETFTVKRGDINVDAKFYGRVEPLALYTSYFQMVGKVREVYANVNDTVKKDQLLGELAEAQELRAKANETKRTIRRAQIALEIAQLTLEQYKSQGRTPTEIKIQQLQVELAQMQLDETLESLGIDPNSTVVDELEAQVAQARTFAPADGTVIAAVRPGQNVTKDTPAFVLGDPNQLEVVADLTTSTGSKDVTQMFEGMPVVVSLDAKSGVKLAGKIRQLPSPYGTGPSDQNEMHIVLDTSPTTGTYQSGDKVSVLVELASKQGILWLPPEAIRSVGGRTFVIVNSDSGPKRVEVEIGLQTPVMVEIISGLEEGQVVVGP
jgi:macrolide-specific efflux system membrane fusion protein